MPHFNTLYIVLGMPAVGKSTFARELANKTGACLIDIDTATEPIVQAAMQKLNGSPEDRDSTLFKETFRAPIYDTLFAIADENLPHSDAIITGPFTKELQNTDWITEIRARLSTPCEIKCLFLRCDDELRKERLITRANPRDLPKLENWDQFMSYYDSESLPAHPHTLVDTSTQESLGNAIEDLIGA